MKVTITVENDDQDVEITRERHWLGGDRREATAKLLTLATEDTRRALDLTADSGTILAAWKQIVTLVGADGPLPLSPASVVDRVAVLVANDAEAQAQIDPNGLTS